MFGCADPVGTKLRLTPFYEGFLVDNYYTLLAVLDREAALARGR